MKKNIPDMVFQSEINECGLASVAMLASTQGIDISLKTLREEYPISGHGTSLANMGDILSNLGINTYPVMFNHDELDAIPLPCILHYGAGHYVVLAYRKGRHVCVMNPAIGQQFLTFDALKRDISGYALVIDDVKEKNNPRKKKTSGTEKSKFLSVMSLRETAKVKGIYRLMTLAFIISLTLFIMPVMVSRAINDVFISAGKTDFPYGLFLMAFVVSTSLALIVRYVTERFVRQFVFLNSTAGFARLLNNPLRFFERRAPGDVFSRFTAWESAASQKIELDNSLRTEWIIGILALGVLAYMSPILALVSLGGVTAMGLVSVWAIYRDRHFTQILQVKSAEQNEFILETLQGFTTIKSSGLVEYRKTVFAKFTDALFSSIRQKNMYEQIKNTIYQLVGSLEMVLFMLLALPLLKAGQLSLGDFFAYSFVREIFSSYITKIFFAIIQKNQIQVIDNRAEDIFPTQKETSAAEEPKQQYLEFSHSLSYDNISFSYDSKNITLKDNSLTLKRGETLAIVGGSGAGKSTLIKVMSGILPPQQGQIKIDGQEVHSTQISSLSYLLSQEDIMFNASVAENISLFDPNLDESKIHYIQKLLDAVGMLEIVAQLPGGLMAKVRESYTGLSLGQRQRLLLARAMYSSRPILVLDEPTANLDDVTAMQVAKALVDHCRQENKTLIAVTHSTSILPLFQHVFLIEQGRISELDPCQDMTQECCA
ncbi:MULTISPECIES: peptidase domain-containing ABC transporter [Rahnella]|uniref:ATP-binding cassette domain-containing protein n=1 Tax=Rahnella laticis TaxID=2787622 RepID=A0ABS0DZW0_9GAMM|nr:MULTISPECIES: ATP-binding cassette domain-containing protein [Rahnella]MBF7978371.1 ATP-binding cassette domain-containing protein [Rahnella laticis]MBF7997912.1 ATP-binding cassette domain-containing protein [Rahnella sp. LAC-M12]